MSDPTTIDVNVDNLTITVEVGTDVINVTKDTDVINITMNNVATSNYVNSDVPFRLDGSSGDTYLLYNSSTGKLELWVDGSKNSEWG